MFFGAFPIVYQDHRGWSEEIGGLSFTGLALGILLGIVYMFPETHRYHKIADRRAETPESRLPPSIVGSIAIPIGLIWFAWTNAPSVHWLVSIAAQIPFGFGFVLVYISVQEYLVDAYTIYAASVLATNTIFRSAFGAVFPLFTNVRGILPCQTRDDGGSGWHHIGMNSTCIRIWAITGLPPYRRSWL